MFSRPAIIQHRIRRSSRIDPLWVGRSDAATFVAGAVATAAAFTDATVTATTTGAIIRIITGKIEPVFKVRLAIKCTVAQSA